MWIDDTIKNVMSISEVKVHSLSHGLHVTGMYYRERNVSSEIKEN